MGMKTLGTLLSIGAIFLLLGSVFTGIAVGAGNVPASAHGAYSGVVSIIAIGALAINLWQIENRD